MRNLGLLFSVREGANFFSFLFGGGEN